MLTGRPLTIATLSPGDIEWFREANVRARLRIQEQAFAGYQVHEQRPYVCLTCGVGTPPMTEAQANEQRAEGHDLREDK